MALYREHYRNREPLGDGMTKHIRKAAHKVLLLFSVIALTLFVGGCGSGRNAAETLSMDGGSAVAIAVECEANLLFSRYDLDVYVDDVLQGSLDHGAAKTFEMSLAEGAHTLRIAEKGNESVDGSVDFTVAGKTTLKYMVTCTGSQVEIDPVMAVNPPLSSSDAVARYHDEIYQAFEQAGFTSIREEELRDLSIDQSDRNWFVDKITVGGKGDFGIEDAFLADDEVVITYRVLADLNPPAASSELEGKDHEAVMQMFKDVGFVNVTSSTTNTSGGAGIVSEVKIGGIFGKSDFSEDDTFPFDSNVEVVYSVGGEAQNEPSESVVQSVPDADLNTLLSSGETNASWFSSLYKGKEITFNGWVASLVNHESYSTRWDVLVLAGDGNAGLSTGPNFRLTDVSIYDMNVLNSDTLREGDNISITAIVGEYDSAADWLELEPVSISVR